MDNSSLILQTVDKRLDHAVRLVLNETQLMEAFSQMKPFEPVELRDAFERAKPVVLQLARAKGKG